MTKLYSLDDLRKVKGIGSKTIERIKEQFDDSEYISKYDKSIHIEPNSLINGDMLEVMNGIPDKSVDMILTDLPYGTTQNKWDNVIDFDKMWTQYNRVIKDNGAVVLFGNEPFSSNLRLSNIDNYKYDWIWDKKIAGGMLNAKTQPMRKVENVMVFYKTQPTYNPEMKLRNEPIISGGNKVKSGNYGNIKQMGKTNYKKTYTHKHPENIIEFMKIRRGAIHPTEKPLELIEYLIKTYTNENDLVLDSTMGSGTTCLGAKNLNRRYIGIELDKEYYKIAKSRIRGG